MEKRDLRGLQKAIAQQAKETYANNIEEDRASYTDEIMKGEWVAIPGNLDSSALRTFSYMGHASKKHFEKVCNEAVSSRSKWTSGQKISDAFTKFEIDVEFDKGKRHEKAGKEVVETILKMIRKRLLESGDWLINEIKLAEKQINASSESKKAKETNKPGKGKGQEK